MQRLDASENAFYGAIPPTWGNLTSLHYLNLGTNWLGGLIPAELGQLTNLGDLYLNNNQLSGAIPPALGNLTNIGVGWQASAGQVFGPASPPPPHGYLRLESNRLSGLIPSELANLTAAAGVDLGCNQFSGPLLPEVGRVIRWGTVDYNLLSGYDPAQYPYWRWDLTQTVPPTNLQATVGGITMTLTWTPIAYTGDDGFYEISYAMTPGGPFTVHGQTADKTVGRYTVTGLTPGATYTFRARTFTPTHQAYSCTQQNDLWSDYNAVVSAGAPVRLWLPLVWR